MKQSQNYSVFGVVAATLLFASGADTCLAATNLFQGLVLRFTVDEIRNDAFADAVTSNALGRVTNVRVNANGKLAAAAEFAAKNSYIHVPNAPALNPKQLAMAVWFKNSKDAWVSRYLLDKGVERGYALSIAGGGKENARRGKLRASVNGRDCFSDAPVTGDLWHHALAMYDGQTLKLYVDGVLQKQTASGAGELAPNTHDLTLGMNRSAPSAPEKENAFDGLMDEVMIFNRVLDEKDIKRVLAAVRPKFTKSQVERRLKELKDLLDRGLILQDFYDRKAQECEVVD